MKVKSLDEHIEIAINGQQQLYDAAILLSEEWPKLTPQEMAQRCENLNNVREKISTTDNDLIEILQLAGSEATHHPRLEKYRGLITNTMQVYDQISKKAYNHKKILQNELSRLKKSRVGLAGYSTNADKSGNIIKENY